MTADDLPSHSRTALSSDALSAGEPGADEQSAGEIRFSPHFSVYILPPDGVCLYSENRKVFLRGELYCAVASRIGEGEHPEAIVEALSREFPSDKIDEAIQRLLDRRFVVPAELIDEAAAGYWASLGLTDDTAAKNLSNTSVQIESMGAAGAEGAGRRLAQIRRSGRRSPGQSDGRSGGRLSRRPTCRIQPSAADAKAGMAAGATHRYFSPDRSDFQPRKERLLDLPRRSHEMESPDQGISRPQPCALRGSVTARQEFARAERDRACGDRDRQGHCQRFSHRSAPACRQP